MRNRLKNATTLIATYALSTGASTVFAHDGHGLAGSHWHSTDVLGFVAVGCLAALAVWLSRRDR
ncbi:MAG TPA: hypothetical protein PLL01_16170 [Rhodoferax sp.]|nr:hypothetical protein [Rhodoferax sp.]